MAEVRVRRLDEAVVLELKERAKREGTSVEAILRRIISDEATRPKRELMQGLREHQRSMREAYGELPDSAPIVREDRERLG